MSPLLNPTFLIFLLGVLSFLLLCVVCCVLYASDDPEAVPARREDERLVSWPKPASNRAKQREDALRLCIRLTENCLAGALCEERTPTFFNEYEVRSGKMRRTESILWIWCAVSAQVKIADEARVARAAAYVLSVMAENQPSLIEAETLFELRRKLYNDRALHRENEFFDLAAPFGLKNAPSSVFTCPWAERTWKDARVKTMAKAALTLVKRAELEEADILHACCARCGRNFPVTRLQNLLCPDCHR